VFAKPIPIRRHSQGTGLAPQSVRAA